MAIVQALMEVFYDKYHCMLITVRIYIFSVLDKDLKAIAISFSVHMSCHFEHSSHAVNIVRAHNS